MKRWHQILFAAVFFFLGMISATVYDGVARDYKPDRRSLYEGLAVRLSLTVEQQVRLDEIVEEARHLMVVLSQETKPRYRSIKRETRDRIREILDAEQLVVFNTICETCDRRRRRRSLSIQVQDPRFAPPGRDDGRLSSPGPGDHKKIIPPFSGKT